ncbi:MAG: Dabb family protein [Planctomycetaceae bacterium]|nr:Dabb family protein [Planctomycetaceae bacterium]
MPLHHNVFFTLKDKSPEKVESLLGAIDKYLTNHDGVLHCSGGKLVPDLARPVNDHNFEVGLNVIFETREHHDVYQTAERHLQFIAEQKENWEQVRVFDYQT